MTNLVHIFKKHAYTKRITFRLVDKDSPKGINIADWSNFSLVVDLNEFPQDSSTNVATISGVITDAAKGRVSFTPPGTIPLGKYFYTAKANDSNGELFTFAQGKFNID